MTLKLNNRYLIDSKGCFRCGKVGHFAKDPSCSAKDKICHKCGFKGHFQKLFNTKQKGEGKEKGASKFNNSNIRLVEEDSSSDEYAFSVGSGTEKNEHLPGWPLCWSVGKMCNPHPRWKTRVGIL